ncbi:hypothetical protein CASFOL_038246 [Castilleja foliolosa]|uniref:Uncharacterized protein n=1 Tax=Castilleja foliolosa TaxID=1961234 RepID=A0ABD3BKF1_9LAMI
MCLITVLGALFVSFLMSDDDDDDLDEEEEEEKGPEKEPDCLWCEKKMSLGPCAENYCCDLPFDTMRDAVEFYKQKRRFGCHKHGGVGNAKFDRSFSVEARGAFQGQAQRHVQERLQPLQVRLWSIL